MALISSIECSCLPNDASSPAAVSSIFLANNALAACLVEVEAETWDKIRFEKWFTANKYNNYAYYRI